MAPYCLPGKVWILGVASEASLRQIFAYSPYPRLRHFSPLLLRIGLTLLGSLPLTMGSSLPGTPLLMLPDFPLLQEAYHPLAWTPSGPPLQPCPTEL